MKQDVIFFDPPWGGPNYKEIQELDLFLSNIELSKIVNCIFKNVECIAIKIPHNFNKKKFLSNLSHIEKEIIEYPFKSFNLLLLLL